MEYVHRKGHFPNAEIRFIQSQGTLFWWHSAVSMSSTLWKGLVLSFAWIYVRQM